MDPIGARVDHGTNFLAETRKIRGQDRRGDTEVRIHGSAVACVRGKVRIVSVGAVFLMQPAAG
ncbi:MAG TPA: hypothetical protein VF229_06175, partial [Burkholderiaceae bacterium]